MTIQQDLDFLESVCNGGDTIARVRAEVERLQAIEARLLDEWHSLHPINEARFIAILGYDPTAEASAESEAS